MSVIHDDSQMIFGLAIESGTLSAEPGAPNYAGRFMYMHSDSAGHHFKNINTRAYIVDPPESDNDCGICGGTHSEEGKDCRSYYPPRKLPAALRDGVQPDSRVAAMVSEAAELLELHGDVALGDL